MRRLFGFRIKHREALQRTAPTLERPYEFAYYSGFVLRARGLAVAAKPGRPGNAQIREVAERAFFQDGIWGKARVYTDTPWGRRITEARAEVVWRAVEGADAVALWNGSNNRTVLAARFAAEAMGKPRVFVEWGLMPDTLQVDPKGVNIESSLADLTPQDVLDASIPAEGFARAESHGFRQRPLGAFHGEGEACGLAALPDLPPGYVLYGAQVHNDTQIRLHSPVFREVEDAIRYVARECEAAGLPLVVKEHPQDHGRIDRTAFRRDQPSVRLLENVDNASLIEGCRAFVTINSSMALQAVHAAKPVFILGEAAYDLPGVVRSVRPPERLADLLVDPERHVDPELRRRYLAYLLGTALVPFHTAAPSEEDIRALAARMGDVAFGV